MNGSDLNVGGVTLVQNIKNPITLARLVLEKTPHSLLGGSGAIKFALAQGVSTVDPKTLISEHAKAGLEEFKKTGYVRTEIGSSKGSLLHILKFCFLFIYFCAQRGNCWSCCSR